MISKDLVAASSKPLILSILSTGENYGNAIIKEVHRLSNGEMTWTDGMLYPVLRRLESQKLVRSKWMISENGRKRKYYSLTTKGRKALNAERQQWLTVHSALSKIWGGKACLT